MAYDVSKLVKLKVIKDLAEKLSATYASKANLKSLDKRVDEVVAVGGEPNVLTGISVNGTDVTLAEKKANLTIPTKVSDLENDQNYLTDEEIAALIAAADHMKRKKVDSVDDIDVGAADAEQYIYMVAKSNAEDGDVYDEYMVMDGAAEKVGDWKVDLSDYAKSEDVVAKETGKSLVNDTEITKLGTVSEGANKTEASATAGNILVDGAEVPVVQIATDDEVKEMLDELFPAGTDVPSGGDETGEDENTGDEVDT